MRRQGGDFLSVGWVADKKRMFADGADGVITVMTGDRPQYKTLAEQALQEFADVADGVL